MRTRLSLGLAAALLSVSSAAQQPPPAPPTFAESNLTPAGVRSMAANCSACHGTEGRPRAGSAVEPLAGRASADIVRLMGDFRSGAKPATVMHQISKGFSDAEIAAVADYFSRQARQGGTP